MYAERLILETNEFVFFKQPPTLPPNSKMEVIFLMLEKKSLAKRKPQNRPKYTLEELLAQCDETIEISKEEQEWLDMKPVGNDRYYSL